MNSVNANDTDFSTTISSGLVLVDFWAEWCGPCKKLAPTLDRVLETFPSLNLVKVDVEQAPNTCSDLGIRMMPTLVLLRDGKEVTRHIGALSYDNLVELIKKHTM